MSQFIKDESWVVCTSSIAEKQQLLDYAASKGVPVLAGPILFDDYGGLPYRDDEDLQIGWCDNSRSTYPSGLMSTTDDAGRVVSIEQFKAMCDAYK